MPLPPLVRFLDPRPADEARVRPIFDSVNLPLELLGMRMHHLPPRHGNVLVAGPDPWATEAVDFLLANGRTAERAADWAYGAFAPGRLWQPNEFLDEVVRALKPGLAYDFACGSGRDAVALAGMGWEVIAVDHLMDALEMGRELAKTYLLPEEAARITWTRLDLETTEISSVLEQRADLISMAWFLNRKLIREVQSILSPGGSLVVETFTSIHRERYGKPRTEAFVLNPGELSELVAPMKTELYDEAWHGARHSARIWSIKPTPDHKQAE